MVGCSAFAVARVRTEPTLAVDEFYENGLSFTPQSNDSAIAAGLLQTIPTGSDRISYRLSIVTKADVWHVPCAPMKLVQAMSSR